MELSFESIANLLKTNPWIGLILIMVGLIYKFGPAFGRVVTDYFKEYMVQKNDKIDKMIGSMDTNNTRFFTLIENQGRMIETIADKMVTAINKVGDGINSMEKTLLSSEARLMERISGIGNMVTEEIRDSKFDTLIKITQSDSIIKVKDAKPSGDDKTQL